MDFIWHGLIEGGRLLVAGDGAVHEVTLLSLQVSLVATAVSLVIGVPIGALLALTRFPGRNLVLGAVNTGMGLPPVVVGLFVALFLWRSGPFGNLQLIYTPAAIILAQIVIAVPLVTGVSLAGVQQLNPKLYLQALALGATRWQAIWLLLREARLSVLAAAMAGFGGAISEVGASLMVGGNIEGQTRVLTTAIQQEVRMGNFEIAVALAMLLLGITFAVNLLLTHAQQRREA